jgi:hypothetical protein
MERYKKQQLRGLQQSLIELQRRISVTPRPQAAQLRHLRTAFALDNSNVLVKPELGAVSEISAEPDGRICSDRSACVQDVCDATRRYAEIECKPICTELMHFYRDRLSLRRVNERKRNAAMFTIDRKIGI